MKPAGKMISRIAAVATMDSTNMWIQLLVIDAPDKQACVSTGKPFQPSLIF